MPVTYTNLLIGFGTIFAVLGFMWKSGVMPTQRFRLIWRRDDPDSFDAGLTLLFVLVGGLLLISLFGVWADRNSSRLMREEEQADGATKVR